jgi:hypothetical protein
MINVGRSKTKWFWWTRAVFSVISVAVRHRDWEIRASKVDGTAV